MNKVNKMWLTNRLKVTGTVGGDIFDWAINKPQAPPRVSKRSLVRAENWISNLERKWNETILSLSFIAGYATIFFSGKILEKSILLIDTETDI